MTTPAAVPHAASRRRSARAAAALAALATVALLALGVTPSSGAPPTIASLPTGAALAANPITGPDGRLWFVSGPSTVSDLAPDGTVTPHAAPPGIDVGDLVLGSGNRVWFLLFSGNAVGYLQPETDTYTSWPTPVSSPSSLTLGPDGNMWYSQYIINTVVRVTPDGTQTQFPLPFHSILGMVAGPDGNLWFSASNPGHVGSIDPATGTVVADHALPAGGDPEFITNGPDGNLWFVEPTANRIGRVTPAGVITEFTAGLSPGAGLADITTGPDGNLWFTQSVANQVGRSTPDGVITEFASTPVAAPFTITAATDGNLYFEGSHSAGVLGVVDLTGQLPTTTTTSTTTTTTTTIPFFCAVSGSPTTGCEPAVPIPAQPGYTG